MQITFDEKGHLFPYKNIETTLEVFKEMFVSSFSDSSTRHELFVGFLHYLNDFRAEITPNTLLWIGGSFVTQKESPSDIDFVIFIDSDIYEQKEFLIDSSFAKDTARKEYGV